MNLYRFQVVLEQKEVDVIIAAKDDETAFRLAQIEVERHYLKLPVVKEMVLFERKKLSEKGGGYVLDEAMD